MSQKIVSLSQIGAIVKAHRENKQRVVHCHGVFDLLHPGHLQHLEAAKREGDILVVSLTSDRYVNKGPDRPAFNQQLRSESIAAIGCVDYVLVNDHPLAIPAIQEICPDVYVKGGEYEHAKDDVTGGIDAERQAVEAHGGRMHFTHEATYSSSHLLNKFFDSFPSGVGIFLQQFRERHTVKEVLDALQSLQPLRVLIIGETIVDEYHYVRPLNKTAKDSIVAQQFISDETFAGGVIACANHVAGFCHDVHIVSGLGATDSREDFIRSKLKSNVTAKFFYRDSAPTIVKRRFIDANFFSKLFELYIFDPQPSPETFTQEIVHYLSSIIDGYDVVIVVDYGHGFLKKDAIDYIAHHAKYLALNTQTNAGNLGFNLITKYPKSQYVCIDEPEARLAMSDQFSPLEQLIVRVRDRLQAERVIITQGHKGCLVLDAKMGIVQIPVLSQKVVDRVGAGDAFLAVTAPCTALGLAPELVGFIGNAVGALAVGIVGNKGSVDPIPLQKFIKVLMA